MSVPRKGIIQNIAYETVASFVRRDGSKKEPVDLFITPAKKFSSEPRLNTVVVHKHRPYKREEGNYDFMLVGDKEYLEELAKKWMAAGVRQDITVYPDGNHFRIRKYEKNGTTEAKVRADLLDLIDNGVLPEETSGIFTSFLNECEQFMNHWSMHHEIRDMGWR